MLGQGYFGKVYLVTNKTENNKKYVAKKMEFGPDPSSLMKCLKEVQLLYSIKHPNIVGYKDYFIPKKGLLVLIMEYCECKFPILTIFSWRSCSPNRKEAPDE